MMKQFSLLRRLTNPVQSNARKITTYHSTNNPHPLHLAEKDNIGIVGLPLNKGQPREGVNAGPSIIRGQGLINSVEALGYHVKDYGDMKFSSLEFDTIGSGVKNPRTIGKAMGEISTMVRGVVEGDGVCVALGGDHSIALGTIHGHMQVNNNACVLWIDAHADLNTPKTSPSGNFHGMPLSFILRELEGDVKQLKDAYEEWAWLKPCLSAKDIAYIGLRDVDAGEQYLMKKLGIKYFCMYEIDKYGISYCLNQALKAVNPQMDRPIHLSYDIDSLDPVYAVSTGTPVMGGLTFREGCFIAEEIAATNMLSVLDMVEVNPELTDIAGGELTANCASKIILSCLGSRIV